MSGLSTKAKQKLKMDCIFLQIFNGTQLKKGYEIDMLFGTLVAAVFLLIGIVAFVYLRKGEM